MTRKKRKILTRMFGEIAFRTLKGVYDKMNESGACDFCGNFTVERGSDGRAYFSVNSGHRGWDGKKSNPFVGKDSGAFKKWFAARVEKFAPVESAPRAGQDATASDVREICEELRGRIPKALRGDRVFGRPASKSVKRTRMKAAEIERLKQEFASRVAKLDAAFEKAGARYSDGMRGLAAKYARLIRRIDPNEKPAEIRRWTWTKE